MGHGQSALKLGKAAGAQRRPGTKRTEDEGHAYVREPTRNKTSEVMESRGLFWESEKGNGSFLCGLETQVLAGTAQLEERSHPCRP